MYIHRYRIPNNKTGSSSHFQIFTQQKVLYLQAHKHIQKDRNMFQSNSLLSQAPQVIDGQQRHNCDQGWSVGRKTPFLFLDLVGVFQCLAIHIYSGTTVTKEGSTGRKIRFLKFIVYFWLKFSVFFGIHIYFANFSTKPF